MLGTFLNLDGDVAVVLKILGKPDGGEVSPAELLNDDVAIDQNFPDVDRVVPAQFVIGEALIFA